MKTCGCQARPRKTMAALTTSYGEPAWSLRGATGMEKPGTIKVLEEWSTKSFLDVSKKDSTVDVSFIDVIIFQ